MTIEAKPLYERPAFNRLNIEDQDDVIAEVEQGADPDRVLKPEHRKGRRRFVVTLWHETGHAVVSKFRGWFPAVISAIREGNVLGYVKSIPDRSQGYARLLKGKIALSFGGLLMERRIGHTDHRGASSDMGQAYGAARELSLIEGGSPENHLKEGRETANGDLNMIDFNTYRAKVDRLRREQLIAA